MPDLFDQSRWNQTGVTLLDSIRQAPGKHQIQASPLERMGITNALSELIGDPSNKRILELGSGGGKHAVLARRGGDGSGYRSGPGSSRALAEANAVNCRFEQADIRQLPFDDQSFDVVIGIAILHHLTEEGLLEAVREAARALNVGGTAVFFEPVENSRSFNTLQNLFPAGKKGTYHYRPSMLNRSAWTRNEESLDDRALTNKELLHADQGLFDQVKLQPFGLTIRLERLLGHRYRKFLKNLDTSLFESHPIVADLQSDGIGQLPEPPVDTCREVQVTLASE